MSKLFEIFVKINDQKFSISISDDKNWIKFDEIYPKLKEVLKIGAKEYINFKTHDFEVFGHHSTNGTQILSFNQFIRHSSVICVKAKPKRFHKRLGTKRELTYFRSSGQQLYNRPDLGLHQKDFNQFVSKIKTSFPSSSGVKEQWEEKSDLKRSYDPIHERCFDRLKPENVKHLINSRKEVPNINDWTQTHPSNSYVKRLTDPSVSSSAVDSQKFYTNRSDITDSDFPNRRIVPKMRTSVSANTRRPNDYTSVKKVIDYDNRRPKRRSDLRSHKKW